MFYGSRKIDDALTFACNTHAPTGAATDADSVPTYRVYEDETGTPILTGSMAKLDDTNTTGFYSEQISLSAANGFKVGKSYTVYIAATVSSVAATMHHAFTIIDNLATASALATVGSYVDTEVAAIKAKTDNLPSDPADQSLIIAATDALMTAIGDVPTNAELATALGTADDAVLAQVALVKAKTDGLTFTVAGKVDANVEYVNAMQITGTGQTGDEWGPV